MAAIGWAQTHHMNPSANKYTHPPPRRPLAGPGGDPKETARWACSSYVAGAFGSDTFAYTEVVGLDASKFNKTQPL